ncbi:MAG: hypothetical protein QF441_00725 [Bacteriovoracaceae bacterium]|jgi:hypothetical protein|nr:hypothetical protein [Halobacteriovoraceae bacterium]MDP7319093.1 hypothetical protein [Bacteriovoracaceae bacterium]
MIKVVSLLILFLWSFSGFSSENISENFRKIVGDFSEKKELKVIDTISKEKNNTKIYFFTLKNNIVGFARPISTTTGCESACLPLIYTAFYNKQGSLVKIYSQDGLTKINHAPLSEEDYANLEFILSLKQKDLESINHPKELTDAISGATYKKYVPVVVKGAAYTTLRVYLYHRETLKYIKQLLENK